MRGLRDACVRAMSFIRSRSWRGKSSVEQWGKKVEPPPALAERSIPENRASCGPCRSHQSLSLYSKWEQVLFEFNCFPNFDVFANKCVLNVLVINNRTHIDPREGRTCKTNVFLKGTNRLYTQCTISRFGARGISSHVDAQSWLLFP